MHSTERRPTLEVELEVLGRRLRSLREDANLRLVDLARNSGYSAGFISQVETGSTLPSLTALATLASCLGVEMTALIEQERTPEVTVTRAGHEDELRLVGQVPFRIHGPTGLNRAFTVLRSEVRSEPDQSRHYGERFVLVLSGSVEFTFGDTSHRLNEGGTIHYAGHQDHTVVSVSDSPASVLVVASPAVL